MEDTTLWELTITMGKLGITKAEHLWDNSTNTWTSFVAKMAWTWGISFKMRELSLQLLEALQSAKKVTVKELTNPDI